MRVSSAPPGASPASRPDTAAPEGTGRGFAAVLAERAGTTGFPSPSANPSAGSGSPVAAVLARLTDAQRTIDRLIDAAIRGRTFTPAQLLALQATVSRDAQAVEVVSRATDRVVGAVKQALGAQI
jgi:hypothetical protein